MKKLRLPAIGQEVAFVFIIVAIAGIVHSINMFSYPYIEDGEGTYMSQAWSVVFLGRLAPYGYNYDHAPAGWLFIACWSMLTGGFHTFGSAINSGRVFMLVLQLANTCLVYLVTRLIAQSKSAALIASLLFALSPYGIYYHRMILLDNICVFWMLLALLMLFLPRLSLKSVSLSAIFLAISILSKELTAFLVPSFLYLLFIRTDKNQRFSMLSCWVFLLTLTLSTYVLMAAVRHELFPSGTWLGGSYPHESLLGYLAYQVSRGRDGGLIDIHSAFYQYLWLWITLDPAVVLLGMVSTVVAIFLIKKERYIGITGLLSLSLWLFLGRGGVTYNYYLTPLLPLLAINTALVFWMLIKTLGGREYSTKTSIQALFICLTVCSIAFDFFGPSLSQQSIKLKVWTNHQADAQANATSWVLEHIPPDSKILIDNSMWTDLHDTGKSISFPFARYYWQGYWQGSFNPKDNIFHSDWHQVDYVITTKQMILDAENEKMKFILDAIAHSRTIAHFDTGGWPVDIRKVTK